MTRTIAAFFALHLFFFGQKNTATAQIPVPGMGTQIVLNGYAKTIRGETLPYFSVFPDHARHALLTRCTDGQKFIEWETAPVPVGSTDEYLYFSWIAAHSTGTSKGTRHFDLYVNDRLSLTFTTQPQQYLPIWSFAGPDSTRMVFEYKKQDGAFDAHGIAYLRVPRSTCTPGQPLRLKVAGQAQNSTDWYMTFQYSFEEKVEIEAMPFLLRGAVPRQPLYFTVLHFGAPDTLRVQLDGTNEHRFPIKNGIQTVELPVPAVSQKTALRISIRIGNRLTMDKTLELRPVAKRDIALVHHAHTDIGYSHYQEEVAAIHTENIRQALRMVESTRGYPDGSRFVWNVESLWAVENFLQEATRVETQQFVQAVRGGQIGLSALYANVLTGLCSAEELRWWTEYADTLRTRYDLPIRSAMFTDIPGLSWEVVPALAERGIRYFSNGPNYIEALPDGGDRIGSTLREQGDRPFWWKSASGRDSILFWTCGKGYSSWHGMTAGTMPERGPRKIATYLNALEAANYPYDLVQWRYNIVSDNGPVDTTICDFVRDWNARYTSPRLMLANVNDVFEQFEKKYGQTIPVLSGDFTPYWEDGAYSTAAEETENRLLSGKLAQLGRLARQQNATLPADWWYQAKRHIILFHEHTWGSWCSISQPDSPFTTRQWAYKKRLLDSARTDVARIERALLTDAAETNTFTVFNTLPWARSGAVELDWLTSLPGGDLLADEQGRPVPLQILADGRRLFVARDVPANGRRIYRVVASGASPPVERFEPMIAWALDSVTGAIRSVTALGREWVQPESFSGLLQALYMPGVNPDSSVRSTIRYAAWAEKGPVLQRMQVRAALAGTNEVVYEISQYNGLDILHLSGLVDKKNIREKESLHFAFPFAIANPSVRVGVGDTFITPEQGQIPGSNKDFFSVQRWLDLSGAGAGVTLCSPQGALFEIGGLIDERPLHKGYKKWLDSNRSASTVFLYAMNNYWHTNYKADQGGRARFDVFLHFHKSFDAGQAQRRGAESVEPLLGAWGR
ncbi:MAG: glycoside hydrolase [Saprospiraceae bacterium]